MSNQVLISQKSSCHPFDFADAAHHILKTKESKRFTSTWSLPEN